MNRRAVDEFRAVIVMLCACAGAAIFLCTPSEDITGGGSSTGNANTIAGILLEPDGATPAKCSVALYRSDAVPNDSSSDSGIIDRASTGGDGGFVFRSVSDGAYNLFCVDSTGSKSKLLPDISVGDDDSLFIGIDTLRYTTDFTGRVANAAGAPTIAFVYGSPLIARINAASGAFMLSGIPARDSINVVFRALERIGGKSCQTTYTVSQAPDTTLFVTVTLECE